MSNSEHINNTYSRISLGHIYQKTKTGNTPSYAKSYSEERYDKYETTRPMSILRYDLCRSIFNFNSVLDFGYGNGDFLDVCSSHGVECFGYDISDYPLKKPIQKIESPEKKCDLFTFFDSIEHLERMDIQRFVSELQTDQIIISLPWFHDIGDEWFFGWKHRRENEHFHHFSASGLCRMVETAGFTPVWHGNPEDKIRKSESGLPNILTLAAVRKK